MRISLVVPNERDLLLWRKPLIQALITRGIEVLVIAPQERGGEYLEDIGCRRIRWNVKRKSRAPWNELPSIWQLYWIYRKWRPNLTHHFTIKPNIYGSICARLAGVPISIATVTGLGFLWTDTGLWTRSIRILLGLLYRQSLRCASEAIFLNNEDRKILGGANSVVLPGEGVDLAKFYPLSIKSDKIKHLRSSLGIIESQPVVLMMSRVLWHKGVAEFVEAAIIVKRKYSECVFLLVGPIDEGNPSHIRKDVIREWEIGGSIKYLGEREDVREVLAMADVVVLPSYREGIPVTLMEAAAMGKPIIATDVPGCRDVVQHGVNGFLVPVRDAQALSVAIENILSNQDLKKEFQTASRIIAENKFSAKTAASSILSIYAKLLRQRGAESADIFD